MTMHHLRFTIDDLRLRASGSGDNRQSSIVNRQSAPGESAPGESPGAKWRRGFTLVEVLATVAVLGVLGSVASMTIATAVDGYMDAATQAQLHSELSLAMDRIDRELRNIRLKTPGGGLAPNITTVTASSITWNTNYSLTLSGSQLMLVENGGAAAVLLKDVTSFSVQAFNESNAAMAASLSGAACDPIRRLRIQTTLQRAGVTETLRNKLHLRCTIEGAG